MDFGPYNVTLITDADIHTKSFVTLKAKMWLGG